MNAESFCVISVEVMFGVLRLEEVFETPNSFTAL